uniref:Uncharacterized protein n=1 Tax=Lepeophtheirus salmonis TaxID=72036 RepID=A0A0K2TFY8_LEPSM
MPIFIPNPNTWPCSELCRILRVDLTQGLILRKVQSPPKLGVH